MKLFQLFCIFVLFLGSALFTNLFAAKDVDQHSFYEYIVQFEGKRNIPYPDTCSCGISVGVGHFLVSNEQHFKNYYSNSEIESFFWKDFFIAVKAARANINNFDSLSDDQKFAILNLVWSCGPNGFAKWIKFRKAVENCNFYLAGKEILDSKWANEVQPARKWSAYNLILK